MKMIVIAMMCVSALTACGKADANSDIAGQSAADEVYQHLREEAAADGVDLDQMISEEIDAYENGDFAAKQEEQLEKARSLSEEYDAFMAGEVVSMKEAYNTFLTAENAETAESAFAAYNAVYHSIGDLYSTAFMDQRFVPTMQVQNLPMGIDERILAGKKLFLANFDESYRMIAFQLYTDAAFSPTFTFIKKADFTAPYTEVKICSLDGTVHTYDLNAYCAEMTDMNVIGYAEDSLVIVRSDFSGGPILYLYLNVHTGDMTVLENEPAQNLLGGNMEYAFEDIKANYNLYEFVSMQMVNFWTSAD
ncbi:MAG: hypothetical protein MJ175_00880 [Clostridia bacterium]|nr:hypothetical protein [Clostridia bacterium]